MIKKLKSKEKELTEQDKIEIDQIIEQTVSEIESYSQEMNAYFGFDPSIPVEDQKKKNNGKK